MFNEAIQLMCQESPHLYHIVWKYAQQYHANQPLYHQASVEEERAGSQTPDQSQTGGATEIAGAPGSTSALVLRVVAVATLYRTCELRRVEVINLDSPFEGLSTPLRTRLGAMLDLCRGMMGDVGNGDSSSKLLVCWLSLVDAEGQCVLGQNTFIVDASRPECGPVWEGEVHAAGGHRSENQVMPRMNSEEIEPQTAAATTPLSLASTVPGAYEAIVFGGDRGHAPSDRPLPQVGGAVVTPPLELRRRDAQPTAGRRTSPPSSLMVTGGGGGLSSPSPLVSQRLQQSPAVTARRGTADSDSVKRPGDVPARATGGPYNGDRQEHRSLSPITSAGGIVPQQDDAYTSDSQVNIEALALSTSRTAAGISSALRHAEDQLMQLSRLCSLLGVEREESASLREQLSNVVRGLGDFEQRLTAMEHGALQRRETTDTATQCDELARQPTTRPISTQTDTVVFADDGDAQHRQANMRDVGGVTQSTTRIWQNALPLSGSAPQQSSSRRDSTIIQAPRHVAVARAASASTGPDDFQMRTYMIQRANDRKGANGMIPHHHDYGEEERYYRQTVDPHRLRNNAAPASPLTSQVYLSHHEDEGAPEEVVAREIQNEHWPWSEEVGNVVHGDAIPLDDPVAEEWRQAARQDLEERRAARATSSFAPANTSFYQQPRDRGEMHHHSPQTLHDRVGTTSGTGRTPRPTRLQPPSHTASMSLRDVPSSAMFR